MVVAPTNGIAYAFYADGGANFEFRKLSGGSFGAAVEINPNNTQEYSVWYDKWTRNRTGNRILLAYIEAGFDDAFFNALDVSDDTLDGETTIMAGVSAIGSNNHDEAKISIVRAEGGNIYANVDLDGGTEVGFFRSVDDGANWTSRNAGYYESALDRMMLVPGTDADLNDVWLLYYDESAGEITLKTYDNSADSWSESAAIISGLSTTIFDTLIPFDAVQRHSDGHILMAIRESDLPSDLKVVDITNATTFSTLTDVKVTLSDWIAPRIFIDQQTDHIYVAYIGDDDEGDAIFATMDVFYKKSTNGGTSWGSQTAMSVTNDDHKQLSLPNCATAEGGMFLPVWSNDDLADLMCNLDNAISFASTLDSAAAEALAATPQMLQQLTPPIPVIGY